MCHFSDEETETSTTQLTQLNKEKLLTTEVLVQANDLLGKNGCLVLDVAEDMGEHIVSLQWDEHTACHIVGISTEMDSGLGLQQCVVVFMPCHRDMLCGEPGGHVRQLDACARLRSLKGTLQDVRVDASTCKETPLL